MVIVASPVIAKSISVTASTLDEAEAKVASIANEQNATYKITEANTNKRVHMTAELIE
ncbi:YdgH/BhsA/McbA-like domain containing protein [Phytobacter sp. V91]|uniref:YdgH/BhsA/McbA-like domain containing protein n=1 Tax=Phytobacter sp. V91 TaxID=3369425 RepID=UPI003F5D9136